ARARAHCRRQRACVQDRSRTRARARRHAHCELELARRRQYRSAVRRDSRGGARRRARRTVSKMAIAADPKSRSTKLAARLGTLRAQPYRSRGFVAHGVLRRMAGMTLEAEGCEAPVGSRCLVVDSDGTTAETEVCGFSGGKLLLVATDEIGGVRPGARVIPSRKVFEARAGTELLGRVLDGSGKPLDSLGPLRCEDRITLLPRPLNPLDRSPIRDPLDVGVRSINALLTVGRGQRLGLFAGSGVGKSVLMGMMTRFTNADVIVVG